MPSPVFQNVQCVLHDTLLALLAGQWHFTVRLASNRLHGWWRAGCAADQTRALSDGRGGLCARGGDVGGIGDTEGLEGGGRSRCGIVSLLVAMVAACREFWTYRAAPWRTLALLSRT